jgi:hypothetical protein
MEGNEVVCGDVFRRIGFQQNVEEAQSQDSALSRGARVRQLFPLSLPVSLIGFLNYWNGPELRSDR